MELPVKERLVGAAILVGLIVVLVPELLSGPKDTETAGGTADNAVRTYTIDLSSPGQPAQTPPPVPEPQSILDPGPIPTPEQSPETPKPASEPEPESKPDPAPPQVVKETPPTIEKPVPVQKPSVAPSSGWAVQLGSFASSDNAKKLVSELRAKGYTAFISSTGSGMKARHRVRVGPVDVRAEADKLAQKLKREGRQVAVVSNS